ncbi:hypothetical protein MHN79_01580 [Vibrio sp. Of14-4]|uniref:hypothetical protein n=1 Tax=Vibrio sp. Of14-4 TaxID=2724878 RepID=UPI001EF185A0|nr:hypothetical protein [Vibrio sp. Of14-4]MCG7488166.1 hypothetical protein [Vibrio sp. Of14-4]
MYKKTSVALAIASLMLFGCGGSGGSTSSQSYESEIENYGYVKDLSNYLDVRIGLKNGWKETMGNSRITLTFDVSAQFTDVKEFKIVAGNIYGDRDDDSWVNGADLSMSLKKKDGTSHTYRYNQLELGLNRTSNKLISANLGGVWTYSLSIGNSTTEKSLNLRINREFTGPENYPEYYEIHNYMMEVINSIDLSTPIKVSVVDGTSGDIAPDGGFSQQFDGKIDDNLDDYTGTEQWVDISSVQLFLSPQ